MKTASIDIGTNSVLLLIVESQDSTCELSPLVETSTITRLGQGVDRAGRLHPEAVERTLDCLREYANVIDQYAIDDIRAVSTSAARDASGVEEFLAKAEQVLGTRPEVISGTVEAKLSFDGAMSGLSLPTNEHVSVFDIGGGSTELIRGTTRDEAPARINASVSLNVGAVRLTERHAPEGDSLTDAQIRAIRDSARKQLEESPPSLSNESGVWIGIGGTITTLAAIQRSQESYDASSIHGMSLSQDDVRNLIDRLAPLSLEQRKHVPGLNPKRADVIVAGALLLDTLMTWAGVASVIVSTRGVRWGLAAQQCRELAN